MPRPNRFQQSSTLAMAVQTECPQGQHPHHFYPRDACLPHYVPNEDSLAYLLTTFFAVVGALLAVTLAVSGRLVFTERLTLSWFMVCGLIHTFLEGYFGAFHKSFPGRNDFFAQVWKEYARSDSRYATNEPFVVSMESCTGFLVGPASFLTAYAIYTNKPYRHVLQVLVSTFQLYGDVLYYATALISKEELCDPHPYYFWFYFVFMNAFWIVIPAILICSSAKIITKNAAAANAVAANGSAGKKSKAH
jgi:cholestenol delta-isomerase